jgi:hypothetical protein
MKKIIYIILYSFLITTIISCSSHLKLLKDNRKYIPYEGNEILVFQSDSNRMDTVFLKGIEKVNGCYDSLSLFTNQCGSLNLICKRTDPNYDRYLDGNILVHLRVTAYGKIEIYFDIYLKGSRFYNIYYYNLTELDNMANSELTIGNTVYKDVKIFEAEDYAKQFDQRANYVERFYWSLEHGLLGLDKKDERWRLIKRYKA